MEEHREAHKFHYRELNKAEDAMSKVLEVKKKRFESWLRRKTRPMTKETEKKKNRNPVI